MERKLIYNITEQWQNELLFYCGVEIVSQLEYDSKIDDSSYDIALVEFGSSQNSAAEFFDNFTDEKYFGKYADTDLMINLSKIRTASSLTEGIDIYNAVEENIIENYVFIPLFYENEYFAVNSKAKDLVYYPFTSSVWFGDAKYFD